jgi:tRNA A-37 threonylcarbamoyl transferase component Bud32
MIVERGVLTLHLPDRAGAAAEVSCGPALRVVTRKRSSHLARWNGRDVFVKLFFDKWRARVHWRREKFGIGALTDRSLLTPALLYDGWLPAQRAYVLITEALTDAQTLAEKWAQAPDTGVRFELLRMVATTLAHQHEAGVVQSDLHPGNFLIVDPQVYSIDTSTIHVRKRALARRASLANLGLLFAQFVRNFDRYTNDVLMAYALCRRWQLRDSDLQSLQAHIDAARAKRKRHFMKKIFRECTAYACKRTYTWRLVYDKRYATPGFQRLYQDPEVAFVGRGVRFLKRGNTATLVATRIDGVDVVIKRYNIKSIWHGIRRVLKRTRASVSWANAHMLRLYDIPTPQPVAFVERRIGPLRRTSYFISEYAEGVDGREFFGGDGVSLPAKEAMAKRIVAALATLARYRVRQGDLKATNIIIYGETPYWVDLDAMREYKTALFFRRAFERDMMRLYRNWEDRPDVWQFFERALERTRT